mmetsp:Transcript_103006/g.317830  ORF Transcript_103006/g.317830 Transcript_103006/m.317830 type:complete len:209 (+) Transcript_103006:1084-1710(+)
MLASLRRVRFLEEEPCRSALACPGASPSGACQAWAACPSEACPAWVACPACLACPSAACPWDACPWGPPSCPSSSPSVRGSSCRTTWLGPWGTPSCGAGPRRCRRSTWSPSSHRARRMAGRETCHSRHSARPAPQRACVSERGCAWGSSWTSGPSGRGHHVGPLDYGTAPSPGPRGHDLAAGQHRAMARGGWRAARPPPASKGRGART